MTTPFTSITHEPPPLREIALGMAIDFHQGVDSDDPKTVVDTADEFLTFLKGEQRPATGPAAP